MRESPTKAQALASSDFLAALGSSLRQWRAFRGARFDLERVGASLQVVAPLLSRWEDVSILTLRREGIEDLFELFDALRLIKPTRRKWVVTSKTLHHLLPDLIVPMDNQMTAPFLGRGSLPATFEASFPIEAYSAFVELASSPRSDIGARAVKAAAQEVPYRVPGAELADCRVGLARDFAIAGFVREHGRAMLKAPK